MTIEEILAGESKNIEFKETLPEKSIKYMKSVVAFANGTGGKIIFGIADKTREVVGFDKEDVFKKMDAIANAVSDSCEPAIIPDITLQTVDGKTVIVVEVSEGRQRPYYIKALGRDGGVYVRVAGTTRLADEYMAHARHNAAGEGGKHIAPHVEVNAVMKEFLARHRVGLPSTSSNKKKDAISLQSRTASPGEGAGQRT